MWIEEVEGFAGSLLRCKCLVVSSFIIHFFVQDEAPIPEHLFIVFLHGFQMPQNYDVCSCTSLSDKMQVLHTFW